MNHSKIQNDKAIISHEKCTYVKTSSNYTYRLCGQNIRDATLSTFYLIVSGIFRVVLRSSESLKFFKLKYKFFDQKYLIWL